MPTRLPSLPRASRGASMGHAVLLTPSKSLSPTQFLSRQHFASISLLAATLMHLLASVANKRLTARLNPLDATLTENTGVGQRLWSVANVNSYLVSNSNDRGSY